MKRLCILLCVSFFCCCAMAQNDFEPGYIVKHNQDTLRGFIQKSMESDLCREVRFKSDSLSAVQVFLPVDLEAFRSENDIYKTIFFQNTLTKKPSQDSSFAKQLVKGYYELYSFYRDERRYFLIKRDTTVYLLFNTVTTGMGEISDQGNYLNILHFVSIPCDKLSSRYDRVSYNEKEMSVFILNLNNCIVPGSGKSYFHKAETQTDIFLFAGGLPAGNQLQFTANASLRFSSPKLSKRTFLNIGIQFSQTRETTTERDNYYLAHSEITRHTIFSIPLTLQYNFTTGIIRPYIYGGFSGAYLYESANGEQISNSGLQNGFGLAVIAGMGIEARIIKRLFAKVDWRYELLLQYPAIGIAYQFK